MQVFRKISNLIEPNCRQSIKQCTLGGIKLAASTPQLQAVFHNWRSDYKVKHNRSALNALLLCRRMVLHPPTAKLGHFRSAATTKRGINIYSKFFIKLHICHFGVKMHFRYSSTSCRGIVLIRTFLVFCFFVLNSSSNSFRHFFMSAI